MDWDAIGAIGEIAGALGVIATLAYLTVQLKQNTHSVQSTAYGMWANGLNMITGSAITDERLDRILREGWTDNKISEESWVTFLLWHQQYFYHLEMVWQMYQRGGLDQQILDLEMGRAAQFLATPSVKQWWEAGGNRQVSKPLAEKLDELRADEEQFVWLHWDSEKGFHPRSMSG